MKSEFVWPEENKARFLLVNGKLMEACEKGRVEARAMRDELLARMATGDPFLHGFEIRIEIQPYQDTSGMTEEAEDAMTVFCEESKLVIRFGSASDDWPSADPDNINLYFNKGINWNIEYFDDSFADEYICYATHALLDKGWEFEDIININQIWVDVQVWMQNNVEF